jgi:UDP-3-O-acyl-N-acetylglucosamine deacetylase
MMDGSALPFFHALRKVAGVPEPLRFYDAPVDFTLEFPRGRVSVSPSDTFEVEYEITRDDGFSSAATLAVYSAEDLYRAFSARTFIFADDYAKARAQGLLAGVDESCGMLFGGAEPPRYRMAEEPACHKILDLLGDLAFAVPALPKVRIQVLNGGHTIHHQIMEKLLPYVSTGNPQEV